MAPKPLENRQDRTDQPESAVEQRKPRLTKEMMQSAAVIATGAVTAMKAKQAAADINWDNGSIQEALPVGANDPAILEFWRTTDGTNMFCIRDDDSDGLGGWYMWNGASWDQVPFTGTSIEGYEFLESAQIVDGTLYLNAGTPYAYTGSGLSWNSEVDMNSSEGIVGDSGFTYDPPTGQYFDSYTYIGTSTGSIFEAGETFPLINDANDHYTQPTSCGDGFIYVQHSDPSYTQYAVHQFDATTGAFVQEVMEGYGPTCEFDGVTTTVYATKDDGYGNWTIFSIEGTHTGGPVDADGDGHTDDVDWDDNDDTVYPGAPELCDGKDNNQDGSVDEGVTTTTYVDNDWDGYGDENDLTGQQECSVPGGRSLTNDDCNDANAAINPGETEVPGNGLDDDCNPATLDTTDADNDGYDETVDCDDNDPNVNPGQTEVPYDGVDNDCEPGTPDDDLDGDGFNHTSTGGTDCNDNDANINPGEIEVPYNGIDEDCDPSTRDNDLDADGYDTPADCNDNNPSINPGAIEQCDEIDHNCDGDNYAGVVDQTFYYDQDGDGYGDPNVSVVDCAAPTDYVANADDCDDYDVAVNPAQAEVVYNGVDDDCNENTPDNDLDGDGHDHPADCDDENANVHPDAEEVFGDGIDNNCDDVTDPVVGGDCVEHQYVEETCEVTFLLAEGQESGTVAHATLEPGSELDIAYDEGNNGYYEVNIGENTELNFESEGTETPIFFGDGAHGIFLGHEGTNYDINREGNELTALVNEPAVSINHDINGGEINSLSELDVLAIADEVGQEIEITLQNGDSIVVIDGEQVYPEEGGDDDDSAVDDDDDTGVEIPDPTDPTCECRMDHVNSPLAVTSMTQAAIALVMAGVMVARKLSRKK